jgi:hypothetical protein
MGIRGRASRSAVRLGKQSPRYRFFLNPYTDVRFMKCPQCLGKTRQRKLPLVQVGGMEPGLMGEPGKMRHPRLTGTDNGHAETSESGVE